jgi:hypothetical protein
VAAAQITLVQFFVQVATTTPHPSTTTEFVQIVQRSGLSQGDQTFLLTALGDRDGYVEVLARLKQDARASGQVPQIWLCVWIHQ